MKKTLLLFTLFCISITMANAQGTNWNMVFEDEFDAETFDSNSWSYCVRYSSAWNKYLVNSDKTVRTENGNLVVSAIVNPDRSTDDVPYLTGGIESRGKVNFKYGKIEVRAKFDNGQGSWPAIWLMPENNIGGWPVGGEIDIMEHLNSDNNIWQTLHTDYTWNQGIKNNPPSAHTPAINNAIYNTYGLEWYPDRLDFTLNGTVTFTYPRIVTDKTGQWPFDKEFYVILNMACDGSWGGPVNDDSLLPFEMHVDWVRIYESEGSTTYSIPGWDSGKTQDDPYWDDTYVEEVTSTGFTNNIAYTATQKPDSYYQLHPETLEAESGSEVTLNLKAFSLGPYNESTVLQDLRYTAAYFYADFDGDYLFEENLPRIGNVTPNNPVGGNFDVLDISGTFTCPSVTEETNARVRVVYHNAWSERFSATTPVKEGVAHDFDLIIKPTVTGVEQMEIEPTVIRHNNHLSVQLPDGKHQISVFDLSGRILFNQNTTNNKLQIPLNKGLIILRIVNSEGKHYSGKF